MLQGHAGGVANEAVGVGQVRPDLVDAAGCGPLWKASSEWRSSRAASGVRADRSAWAAVVGDGHRGRALGRRWLSRSAALVSPVQTMR